MSPMWFQVLLIAASVFGVLWSVVYIVDYQRLSRGRWRRSELGWYFMAYPTAFGCLFAAVIATRWVDSATVRRIAILVTVWALVCTLPWMHRLMRLSMRREGSASTVDAGAREVVMLARIRKALVAGFGAAVSAALPLYLKLQADGLSGEDVGAIVGAAAAAGIALGIATWRVPNAKDPAEQSTTVHTRGSSY